MSTIFDKFKGDVDLSIFKKSNTDPKTPLRRHYLSLVGLLEYVDIFNGELTGRELPEGITEDVVKGMIVHGIGDLDTVKVMVKPKKHDVDPKPKPDPKPEQHEYVDLGLKSGTLWATENIKDAKGNELYFAWGETQGYTADQVGKEDGQREFTWDDYEFGIENALKKYTEDDGKTELESKDDAATVNWDEGWKMPTGEQFQELIDNTEHEWTEVNGVRGVKVTSKIEGYTDRFLFFPAVGSAGIGEVFTVGTNGGCWTTSLQDGNVCHALCFALNEDPDIYVVGNDARFGGHSIRPVRA